jgi:hypothetical protein
VSNHVPIGGRVIEPSLNRIVINEIRLLEPASLTFCKGGCDRPGADMRAELVNVPSGTLFMVPFSYAYAERLYSELGDILGKNTRTERDGH